MTIEARVVAELITRGRQAFYEYPGVVHVPLDAHLGFWTSSSTNRTWTVDLQHTDGRTLRTWDTGIPSTCGDLARITNKIEAVIDWASDPGLIFDKVAEALTAAGVPARSEHTGGGIYCVFVPAGENREWCIGTGCETWAGDLVTADDGDLVCDDGLPMDYADVDGDTDTYRTHCVLTTDVDSESYDVAVITAALLAALARTTVPK